MPARASGDPVFRFAQRAARLLTRWHRAELHGAHHVPDGPVLLVGNHGLFGLETPVFFWLLDQATGRQPRGLADRVVFGNPLARRVLERVGGVVGTPANAARLLADGNLVVCYPGGAREVFKRPSERYQLRWDGCLGFARVAIAAQAPIVPFAGLGVDDGYVNFGHLRAATRLFGRYAAPVALGLGPLPLPTRLQFVLGRPILPPADAERAPLLKAAVERAVRQLLASKGTHAVPAQPAFVVP